MQSSINRPYFFNKNFTLRLALILYILFLGIAVAHHEMWSDEIHSWNIAKASTSFSDLIFNSRYEGHPPVWYVIMWTISKFTHNLLYVQIVHASIASLVVFIILFHSPFPVILRLLIPFGYFFLFEYAVLSRNYAPGLLALFCICTIIPKNFNYKIPLYYFLLLVTSNTHLIALLLAASLHLYFLLSCMEKKQKFSILACHVIAGSIVFIISLYIIFPSSDSEMNMHFWIDKWNRQQLLIIIQAPLKAFMPIPAWWNYHFWNTQFILEAQTKWGVLKVIYPAISFLLLLKIFLLLKRNKKCLLLFFTNFIFTCAIAFIFPLTSTRYTGFIFIAFLVAYWLSLCEKKAVQKDPWFIYSLLLIQLISVFIAVSKDLKYPFSNAYKVKELVKEIPPNTNMVTDYWALNTLAAFMDKPFYCIDLQQKKSFILWDKELANVIKNPSRFANGFEKFFTQKKDELAYMISLQTLDEINLMDSQFLSRYKVTLVDKREGAIEKGSNLYLYKVYKLTNTTIDKCGF